MAASVYTNTAGQGYVFNGSALRPTGVIFANRDITHTLLGNNLENILR